MCEPISATTMAIASLTATAASGGLQAYGAAKAAKGQKSALIQQSNDAAANATLARLNGKAQVDIAEANAGLTTGLAAINARTLLGVSELNASSAISTARIQGQGTIALAGINANSVEKIAGMNASAAVDMAAISGGMRKAVGDFNFDATNMNAEMLMANANFNANMAEMDAQDELDRGRVEQQSSGMQFAQLKSTQVAQLAANGVALDEGSSLRLLTSTDYVREVDSNRIYMTAARAALGHRIEGMQMINDARLKSFAMKADAMGAKLSLDVDIAKDNADAGFYAATTRAQGGMDAFNIRQGAAWSAFTAQTEADNYALNTRVNAAAGALNLTTGAAIDALNMRTNAQMGALNSDITAANYTSQSTSLRNNAGAVSPLLAAGTSMLGTAAQVAGSWYSMNKSGMFGRGGAASAAVPSASFAYGSGNIRRG